MRLSDILAHVTTAFEQAKCHRGDDGGEDVEDEAGRVCETENASYEAGEAGRELPQLSAHTRAITRGYFAVSTSKASARSHQGRLAQRHHSL